MAFYSFVIYAGNGTNRTFSINFPYLDKSHVKAKINSAPTTAFSWLNNSTIQFTTAPAAGNVIEIYRETPQNSSPVDFTDGSILLERDLDLLATFNLYVGQEATDKAARAISVGSDGAFNALGLRVSNAADPVNAQDLVTKQWAENSVSSGINQAQTAAASAAAAATTASNAAASAQSDRVTASQAASNAVAAEITAVSASNTAATAKVQAVSAKDTAVTKATEATTSATSANAAAVAAQNAKDAAVTAQTNATTASSTVVTKATEAANSATSALNSKNAAATSESNAAASANLAQNWASSTGLVNGVSFGAKKYATDAATSATQAGNSAASAASSLANLGNAETNAVAAKVAAESARDTAVSAKNTAVQAAADAQSATPGAVKVSNTDTTSDKLNNKLTVAAPLTKTVKNGGAYELLELGINLSSYVTKAANTFTGAQTMPNIVINSSIAESQMYKTKFNDYALFGYTVTLRHNTSGNNMYLDCQASADIGSTNVGIRWANAAGNVKFQQYFTPSTGVMQNYATDGTAEYRWSIQGATADCTAASLNRNTATQPDYYCFNVGDPANTTYGASVNIYGATAGGRSAKLLMFNSNTVRGGFIAADTDFLHLCTAKHMLCNFSGEPFLELWRNQASLTYSGSRNNRMDWQNDGNVVLIRNGSSVWAINNYVSDARLKEDIKPLGDGVLEKVKQLNAKTYLWKDNLMGKGDKREIGLIAQEVQEVFPEVVSKVGMDDNLGIAYQNLVPVLVAAIKELSAKVEALEAQVAGGAA